MDEELSKKLLKIRSKFEKKMGDAWEKYDSSEYENDLEDYGDDYEAAYSWLFEQIMALIASYSEEKLKSGFYAGQAMARVELDDCHANWKKWNSSEPEGKPNE
jgi:hypothetical protein